MAHFAVRQNRRNRVVYRKVIDLDNDLQQAIRSGWFLYLAALRKRANKAILAKDKRGRTYIIRSASGRRRRHRASAPGQSHANRRGTLRKSMGWKVFGWERASFGYGVSSKASATAPDYAPFIELGTGRMDPRPSLQNAVEDEPMQPHFDRAFDREFAF